MKNLKILRNNLGLTQTELAEKLGMPQSNYSCYELGKANPPLEIVIRIADFFGCSVDYLLGHQVKENKRESTPAQRRLQEEILDLDENEFKLVSDVVDGVKVIRKGK